ncbi:MAG: DUF1559 domain-containing protein [Gemmataceae bacterium]
MRRGFSLIEVLVVISIMAILVGLLLPGVQKVRAAADRAACSNNLKQIALASHMHHNEFGYFPRNLEAPLFSPFTAMLPYLEQDAIAQRYDRTKAPDDPGNLPLTKAPIPAYTCPAMRLPEVLPSTGYSSYVTCSGSVYLWAHINEATFGRHNGIFAPNQTVTAQMVSDGLSCTFAVGEAGFQMLDYRDNNGALLGGNTSWPVGYPTFSYASAYVPLDTKLWVPQSDPTWRERSGWTAFRSDHNGGANFAFGDGSVRFISDSINQNGGVAYRALASRDGGEPVDE